MEEIELIDGYYRNLLSQEERAKFEQRLREDSAFRERVDKHIRFLEVFRDYGRRKALSETLDEIHAEALSAPAVQHVSLWKKYLPSLAIAASVALVSIVGTYVIFRANDDQHQANYLELRKNVERLNKSHNQLLENMNADKDRIAPSKYSGTGFLVSPDGYVVTAYHVVRNADSIFVENERFGRHKVSLVYSNPSTDMALLLPTEPLAKGPVAVPFSMRPQDASLGESVYTLGYPREDIVYGDGAISAATGYDQNEKSYQISIPVNPGNSGGPMIDGQGAVVGMISGVQPEARGAAFAIKSGVLLEEIKMAQQDTSLTVPLRLNNLNQLAGMSRVNQIKKWREFVFNVKVYHGK